ncbi:RNA polymerase-associated protein LEO1 [Hyalella azteca]|uniref:RNA polymerase-associated protein LEO1 n=1 Tax=Hyalella azteca TaxID=294128 RepID=A0A979FKR6_HYAAZ|nr:RNA polymerase-associated protein LEO1 [Hyalella azteca]
MECRMPINILLVCILLGLACLQASSAPVPRSSAALDQKAGSASDGSAAKPSVSITVKNSTKFDAMAPSQSQLTKQRTRKSASSSGADVGGNLKKAPFDGTVHQKPKKVMKDVTEAPVLKLVLPTDSPATSGERKPSRRKRSAQTINDASQEDASSAPELDLNLKKSNATPIPKKQLVEKAKRSAGAQAGLKEVDHVGSPSSKTRILTGPQTDENRKLRRNVKQINSELPVELKVKNDSKFGKNAIASNEEGRTEKAKSDDFEIGDGWGDGAKIKLKKISSAGKSTDLPNDLRRDQKSNKKVISQYDNPMTEIVEEDEEDEQHDDEEPREEENVDNDEEETDDTNDDEGNERTNNDEEENDAIDEEKYEVGDYQDENFVIHDDQYDADESEEGKIIDEVGAMENEGDAEDEAESETETKPNKDEHAVQDESAGEKIQVILKENKTTWHIEGS